MEQAPVLEMSPEMTDNGDPKNMNNDIYILSKRGEYYLVYVADAEQTIEFTWLVIRITKWI